MVGVNSQHFLKLRLKPDVPPRTLLTTWVVAELLSTTPFRLPFFACRS